MQLQSMLTREHEHQVCCSAGAHQLSYVLAQLDVDPAILKAQPQQLVSAAFVTGMQLLLPGFLVVIINSIE